MLITTVIIAVITFKILNFAIFAIFDHFRKNLYSWKVSKPQNREIKYPRNLIPAKFEIIFFLIFDQSMILIPAYRISLLIVDTITLINNRKIDTQREFRFLFLLKSRN